MRTPLPEMPILPTGLYWQSTGNGSDEWPGIQHAVKAVPALDGVHVSGRALCGLRKSKWASEMWSDEYCKRCMKILKLQEQPAAC